jgi:glycosyltransferase involved in cell wall biosynthesis
LMRAFAEANLPPDTQVALGGTTTFGAGPVDEAIEQAGIAHRVRRLAYVPDADLPALYSGAACVAIVSLYEGFGMPALEALACGALVVASNRGSLPEILGDAGLVADPLDVGSIATALERAVGDPEVRGALRAGGPRRAAQFNWASAARVTRQVLEQASLPVTGKPPRSPRPSAAR